MILKFKVTPRKLEATTKASLVSKIRDNFGLAFDSIGGSKDFHYSCLSIDEKYTMKKYLIVYNLHKVRTKTSQKKRKSTTSYHNKTQSTIVRHGHWIAYVYKFDADTLKQVGVKKLEQNSRNFTMEFHK